MSRLHKEEISCPDCAYVEETNIWDLINVKDDADLKEEVLLKKLQSFYCSNCQAHYVLEKSFLYLDPDKKLLLYYCPNLKEMFQLGMLKEVFTLPKEIEKEFPEQVQHLLKKEDWTFRLCLEYNDLIEKVHLFDHALFDDVLEVLKLALRSRLAEEEKFTEKVYFLSGDAEKFVFQVAYLEGEWESIELPTSMYMHAEKVLKKRLPEAKGFCLRDEAFAHHFVKTEGME